MTCSLRLLVITSLFALSSCRPVTPEPEPTPEHSRPLRGTDFSQLPKIEAEGFVFTDTDGNQKDALEILHEAGLNIVRLKVWNNPTGDGSLQELFPSSRG